MVEYYCWDVSGVMTLEIILIDLTILIFTTMIHSLFAFALNSSQLSDFLFIVLHNLTPKQPKNFTYRTQSFCFHRCGFRTEEQSGEKLNDLKTSNGNEKMETTHRCLMIRY